MKKKINYVLMLAVLLGTQACEKDKKTEEQNANYVLSVTAGAFPAQKSYLFSTKEFPTGSIGTSNAKESESSAFIFKYGKYIYQNNFATPATLTKYEFGADGKPIELGSFVIPGLRTIGAVDFISDTEAYATVASSRVLPQLVKFNPSTMQVIKLMDLSLIAKSDARDIFYMGIIHRGNHLYMGVNYQKVGGNLENKVFVAIIDRTTGAVKLISDDRSNQMWNGGTEAGFSPNSLIKDSNDDIYVMGYATDGKPSGVLRIKNNETDFDPTYFFNLSTTIGKPCLGLLHLGNGQTFTVGYDEEFAYPFDFNPNDNFNPYASGRYYKIDLVNKTTSGLVSSAMPKMFGNKAFATKFNDNSKIYFNVAEVGKGSVYSYQVSNGTVAKEFELSSGPCNGFAKLN